MLEVDLLVILAGRHAPIEKQPRMGRKEETRNDRIAWDWHKWKDCHNSSLTIIGQRTTTNKQFQYVLDSGSLETTGGKFKAVSSANSNADAKQSLPWKMNRNCSGTWKIVLVFPKTDQFETAIKLLLKWHKATF